MLRPHHVEAGGREGQVECVGDAEIDRVAEPDPCVQITATSMNSGVRSMPVTLHPYFVARNRAGPPMPHPTSSTSSVEASAAASASAVARDATERVELLGRCDRGRIEIVGIVASGAQRIEDRSAEMA